MGAASVMRKFNIDIQVSDGVLGLVFTVFYEDRIAKGFYAHLVDIDLAMIGLGLNVWNAHIFSLKPISFIPMVLRDTALPS
jgi:hypothetical protein